MIIYSGLTHWTWWFPMVMLNYQRVHGPLRLNSPVLGYLGIQHPGKGCQRFDSSLPSPRKDKTPSLGRHNRWGNWGQHQIMSLHVICTTNWCCNWATGCKLARDSIFSTKKDDSNMTHMSYKKGCLTTRYPWTWWLSILFRLSCFKMI